MKYLGSKAKLAKYIVPILQNYVYKNNIKTYIEPFVGGFNIIDKITCNNKIGCDIDPLVIDLVETCRNNPKLLDTINETPSREHYYDVRDNANKYPSWYRAAILLFASYNARVYGGCYGAIAKTKDGKMRNYYQESKNNFQNQLPNLYDILVSCCDYRDIIPSKQQTLIYCDPPYKNGVGYVKGFDTDAFWQWCRDKTRDGHIVVISEYDAPNDFKCIWQHETTTHLNNRNKLPKIEKLFVYGGNNNV